MRFFLLAITCLACSAHVHAQSLDYKIIRDLNIKSRDYDNTFRFFSTQNKVFIAGLPLALAIEGYLKKDKDLLQAGKNAFISLGASTAITWALKYSCRRGRPYEHYQEVIKLDVGGGPSFPSGHTSAAFAVATSVSISYPKWYVIAPCYLWAGTVGVSRIALGVHYPSDVWAGALVGAASAYVTNKASHWLGKSSKKRWGRI